MMLSRLKIQTDSLAALFTWLLVAGSALTLAWGHPTVPLSLWWLSLLCYIGFVAGFVLAVRDTRYTHDKPVRLILLFWQFACVIALYICLPYSYNAILMTMLSGQVVYYVSIRRAILLSVLWSAPLWLIQSTVWGENYAWLTALLFWTFNIFAMMMIDSRRREEEARQSAEAANRELTAAQAMLQRATREQERTRIARNIHDLLGHHLTALSIHLQVASRQAANQSQPDTSLTANLERCHNIARLLLQDVREAVSDLRETQSMSLQEAMAVLTKDLPGLEVRVTIPDNLPELSFVQANAIIKAVQECITNTLRHSGATRLSIVITCSAKRLQVVVEDNGNVNGAIIEGNGLSGIRERIAEASGNVWFRAEPAMVTTIEVPVTA